MDKLIKIEVKNSYGSERLKAGDVVQITDKAHDWHPLLRIVDEPKDWGCQAYALHAIVRGNISRIYLRLKTREYTIIGPAAVHLP